MCDGQAVRVPAERILRTLFDEGPTAVPQRTRNPIAANETVAFPTMTLPSMDDFLQAVSCPLRRSCSSGLIETFAQRSLKNIDGPIDFLRGNRQRRGDAPHRPSLWPPADIHAEAILKALTRCKCPQLMCRRPGHAIGNKFDSQQKPQSPDIAYDLVTLLQFLQPQTKI